MFALSAVADELTAVALGLLGVHTHIPANIEDKEQLLSVFEEAVKSSGVVLVTQSIASQLPGSVLQAAWLSGDCQLGVLPEIGAEPKERISREHILVSLDVGGGG